MDHITLEIPIKVQEEMLRRWVNASPRSGGSLSWRNKSVMPKAMRPEELTKQIHHRYKNKDKGLAPGLAKAMR